jgi:GNAT superfamily N-acetyltransferase
VTGPPDSGPLRSALATVKTAWVLSITPEPFDALESVELSRQYHDELDRRFPAGHSELTGSAVTASDFLSRAGVFLVVRDAGIPVGCAGLKEIDSATAEIKHMWVAPTHRRSGIARQLLADLEAHAVRGGHARVVLDTSEFLPEAVSLYRDAGYGEIAAYNSNPYATHWFEKHITDDQHAGVEDASVMPATPNSRCAFRHTADDA